MNKLFKNVLAPHTDDGEFGTGGTIARLLCLSLKEELLTMNDNKKTFGLLMNMLVPHSMDKNLGIIVLDAL